MNISKFAAPPPRACAACRVPLRPAERELCRPCSSGHDFLSAADCVRASESEATAAEVGAMNLEDARILAQLWMEHHGLRGWRFGFDRAKSRFGACHWRKRLITLSAVLTEMNDEAEVEDVILHEIAHAIAGHKAGHGPAWKAAAEHIGARPERCYSDSQVCSPPPRWIGVCPNCGKTTRRHRRRNCSCGRCNPKYDPRYRLQWSEVAA
jgi:SprT protein